MATSTTPDLPGGTWTLGDRTVTRFGYGAMQLAGPWVVGPPKDHEAALAVLRAAVGSGITHIDTAETYGPRVVNDLIREALHPYADDLVIATKAGGRRDENGGWPSARKPDELRAQIDDNLETLGVDSLDLVHLRLGDADGPVRERITEAFETLVDLQQQGVIRHLGVSNATPAQVEEAQSIAPIVSVQNMYNLANRWDDALIDRLADEGVAYIPFFPPRRVHPAAVRRALGRRRPTRLDTHVGRPGVAAAPVAEHPPDPRDRFGRPPARKHRRRRTHPLQDGSSRARPHLGLTRGDAWRDTTATARQA